MERVLSKASAFPEKGLPPEGTEKAISIGARAANPALVLPAAVDQMLERGDAEEDCAKSVRSNSLRVFDKVWGGSKVAINYQREFYKDRR